MSQISVDVLITFYNQESYVDQAIHSVLNQKGDFALRVLVGDDGSTDHTMDIIEKYVQKNPDIVQVFRMDRADDDKTIGGFRASKNRINLLKQVRADYFIFLDGDDFFDDEWKLQKQISVLEDEENTDCVACGHAIDILREDGSRAPYITVHNSKNRYTLEEYWIYFYCHTDTILARSKVIMTIPFDLIEHNFNDNMITFLFLTQGNLYYLPETMAVYRQTGKGVWTSGKVVHNYLRNMMIYDLCIKIRPDLKRATQKRFSSTWKMLYENRFNINREACEVLYNEAVAKNLIYTKLWIDYEKLTFQEKYRLMSEYREMWFFRLLSKYRDKRLLQLLQSKTRKIGYSTISPFF